VFRLYNRNGKITSISATERDEPHLKISDQIAAKLMDSKRNPDDWLVVGSRLQRIGESPPQRINKLVMFRRTAAPVGLIATVDRTLTC
jgi:hypothetical protein